MGNYLGLGRQSAQDTSVTPTRYINPNSFTPRENNNAIFDEGYANRSVLKHARGNLDVGGDFTFKVSPENCGEVLYGVFGGVTSTQQGATDAYLHTFKHADSLPWYTVEHSALSSKARIYTGCVFDSLGISATEGEALLMSPSFTATTHPALASAQTPSFDSKDWFSVGSTVTATVGGVATYTIKSFDVTIQNNIEKDYGIDSYVLGSATPGAFKVTGSLDLLYAEDVWELFLGADASTTPQSELSTVALDLKWVGATIASTYYDTLELDFGGVVFNTESFSPQKGTRAVQTIGFEAVYDATDTTSIVAMLTNETTAYKAT